jgi:hypothetical protein
MVPRIIFALWHETGRLPVAVEPTDADSRRRFHIRFPQLSGASGRFTDLIATDEIEPTRLKNTTSGC